ncbi:MAG: serine acetyltransferase [Erysipelotrichaceae bacterium]|nr:serine acetyltransferase [Erysipelotrichaceae bacterium]
MDKKELANQISERYEGFVETDYTLNVGNIKEALNELRLLLFGRYFTEEEIDREALLDSIEDKLGKEIAKLSDDETIITRFLEALPEIQRKLYKDVEAIYYGDPACKAYTEVILSYPGFYAIFHYRIAHELYTLGIPILARVIGELGRETTAIDIHPGAQIGESFCIDHGQGIVIGETTVVGDNVRMYHGVTLGVKRFKEDENGHLQKGWKRHPNIGNHVTLYANATILGGDTFVADGSTIHADALITSSTKGDNKRDEQ